MITNTNGKIMIEATEDKRFEVAIELAKTVNNLAEMLKNMDTSISNIHINGCNIQTAQGETAVYMGNNVKNSMISNSRFETGYTPENNDLEYEDDNDETYEESVSTFNVPDLSEEELQDEVDFEDVKAWVYQEASADLELLIEKGVITKERAIEWFLANNE